MSRERGGERESVCVSALMCVHVWVGGWGGWVGGWGPVCDVCVFVCACEYQIGSSWDCDSLR